MHLTADISPEPVSKLVDDGSGQPEEIQANKNQKPNKKETAIERGNLLDSEIPDSGRIWWMMKFHYREVLTPVLLMKFL